MNHTIKALALGVAALALHACSDAGDAPEAAEVSNDTLAMLVAQDSALSTAAGALGDAGLSQVFDGAASYTFFAPSDAAFDALGEAGTDLRGEDGRAAMAAVLRNHIVPGYLAPEDIGAAIDAGEDGSVSMRTVGGTTLTFRRDGEALVASTEDGASARLGDTALRATNGVAVPLDAVLYAVPEASE